MRPTVMAAKSSTPKGTVISGLARVIMSAITPGKGQIMGTMTYPRTRTVSALRAISRLSIVWATSSELEWAREGCRLRYSDTPRPESGPFLPQSEQMIIVTAIRR